MIKLTGGRVCLFLLTAILIAAMLVAFNTSTFAQGDWDYMCDSWESSCDDGSGDWWESGGGGEPHGPWICPDMDRCNSLGCNPRSYLDRTMVCSRWKKDQSQTYSCPSPVNCAQSAH